MKTKTAPKKFTATRAKAEAPVGLTESGASYFDTAGQAAETVVRAHAGARRHAEAVETALKAEKEAHLSTTKEAELHISEAETKHFEEMTAAEREHGLEMAQLKDQLKNTEVALVRERERYALITRTINAPLTS